MIKSGLVLVACSVIATGCALVDDPQPEVETREAVVIPLVQPDPKIIENETTVKTPPRLITARRLSRDEIRRMQVRLREVGLDPGPIDGVAGVKTKAAAIRFQSGCAELQSLLTGNRGSNLHNVAEQTPDRLETLALQNQLCNAGFDPGRVDGVFGAKMKNIFSHLQNGCPMAEEFVASLEQPLNSSTTVATPLSSPERAGIVRAVAAQNRQEAAKSVTPSAMKPQEDIRILQLRLRDAGYDPGPFDGVMGPKTKLALQQMQAKQSAGKTKHTVTAGIGTQY
jgi:peptidoglycan hydrolase-like protein with peptidoglycan-binding domain